MSADSSDGILDNFMGNYETLQKPVCANKIGAAMYFAILQQREKLEAESDDELDRYFEYLNLTEELNPKSKPKKSKKKKDDDEETEEADEDEDEDEEEDKLAYSYTYIAKLPVKGADKKATGEFYESEEKKKKFVSMPAPVKQILQYVLNCLVHECYKYYEENGKSFPADESNILSEVAKYAQKHCEDAISPFVFEVADLYGDVSEILDDETKKGTGVLRSWMDTEFKKIFQIGKSKKPMSTQLIRIQDSYINFLKALSVFMTDHLWENRTAINIGKILGTFRQISRLVAKNGGECPPVFYEYAKMYVEQNTTKRAASKGKGKGAGKAPASKGKAKGKGAGKAPASKGKAKGKGAVKRSEPEPEIEDDDDDDFDDDDNETLGGALDAVDDEDDDDFGENWADDALPDDE
jgi:hypothetical protein